MAPPSSDRTLTRIPMRAKILLEEGSHANPVRALGVGKDGQRDLLSAGAEQAPALPEQETRLPKQTPRGFQIERRGLEMGVPPEVVGRRYRPFGRGGQPGEHHFGHARPVDRVRDRPAEADVLIPALLGGRNRAVRIQVEPKALHHHSRSQIHHVQVTEPGFLQVEEGFGRERIDEVDLARLEPKQARVGIRDDLEYEAIQSWKRLARPGGPPVTGIALQDDPLAGYEAFEDERSQANDIARRAPTP